MTAGFKAIVLTLLLAATVYLAGNARVQLWDRDEPRYAECSRQMLQSGDWIVPRLYDKLRFQKPPLIYWCQASAMKLIGSEGDAGAFAARLPSTLAVLGTLILLATAISAHSGKNQAAWTLFIFATSAMTIVAAKSCLTDGVLILFVTAAQLCCYGIWRGNRSWRIAAILGVALGLGILTKGPFILGIVGATAGCLGLFALAEKLANRRNISAQSPALAHARSDQRMDAEGLLPGYYAAPQPAPAPGPTPRPAAPFRLLILIALAAVISIMLVLPWIHLVQQRAPEFLPAMLHEGKQHTLEGKEGHHFPPGYHAVLVWAMFMPWSLLLPLGIGVGIANRHRPDVRFALAAVFGPWVMVELMGTKLPHYFLPAYPAMAFLVAFAIRQCLAGKSKALESRAFLSGAAAWAVAVVVIGALPWAAAKYFRPLPWGDMATLTIICLLLGPAVFLLYRSRRFAPAFVAMGIGMAVVIGAIMHLCMNAEYLRVSTRTAEVLQRIGATHPGDVKMVDYKEPSLAFYQGGTIREVEKKADLIYKPLSQWPRWVVITRDAWDLVPANTRARLRVIDSCHGWAYADKGRVLEVMVVENSVY